MSILQLLAAPPPPFLGRGRSRDIGQGFRDLCTTSEPIFVARGAGLKPAPTCIMIPDLWLLLRGSYLRGP